MNVNVNVRDRQSTGARLVGAREQQRVFAWQFEGGSLSRIVHRAGESW
jgi:hypothetical protein